jgi:hypothetical protein
MFVQALTSTVYQFEDSFWQDYLSEAVDVAITTCNDIGRKIPDWSNVYPHRNSMRLRLSRWPCTRMIDGLRVDVMSCVCYDWSSVGAGMREQLPAAFSLTDVQSKTRTRTHTHTHTHTHHNSFVSRLSRGSLCARRGSAAHRTLNEL